MVERTFLEQFTGATLGNYRLEQLIEQSKWGPVFLATSQAGTPCVIRLMSAQLQENELDTDAHIVFLGRFQQEANQVATLQHPHVLPLLDYGTHRGIPYLVYPHVPLTSLRSLLAQNVPTDLKSVGRYLDQIASALEYAHQHAVIHRNLSTSSIYMQSNRQLTVGEFGLMRMYELSQQENQQPTGRPFKGSSESSSPEQLLGKPIDAYTDIYALGAVLYRLLTGHSPFSGKTRDEVTRQHLYAEVPSLKVWREGLPVAIDHVITKAMAKEPMQRYRQPVAFAQAYHQIVAPREPYSPLITLPTVPSLPTQSFSQPLAAPKTVKAKRKWRLIPRRRLITLLTIGGFVLTVGGGMAIAGAELLQRNSTGGTSTPNANTTVSTASTALQNRSGGSGAILAHRAEVPLNSAKTFALANQSNPGVLIHLPDNRFVAFDTTCTHEGCEVKYDPQDSLLKCPCHDAFFNPAQHAAVVQGPAQTPLAPIKITVNADGTIVM